MTMPYNADHKLENVPRAALTTDMEHMCKDPDAETIGNLMAGRLLTREEAMDRLRLKPAHFSKVTSGKVKGLPKLACVRIGRRQLFREETIDHWIVEVEALSCKGAR
jgi:hypothetical protein